MRYLFPLLTLWVTSCASYRSTKQYCSLHYSYYDGKQYEFCLTEELVRNTPKWDPKVMPNPPLVAAKALHAAEGFIEKLPKGEGANWQFEQLALTKVFDHHWAWKAEYYYISASIVSTGPPITMQCWILMDGTVVQPQIKKDSRF